MRPSTAVAAACLLLIPTVGTWWWLDRDPAKSESEPAETPAAADDRTRPDPTRPAAPDPAAAGIDTLRPLPARPAGADGDRFVQLPDGSWLPALNGTRGAPRIRWDPERPPAAVVGRHTDEDGITWFRHGDGSLTTTRMMWRDDLGRLDATSLTQHPGDLDPAAADPRPAARRRR